MELFTSIKELLESGDPTIRSWFLVQSMWTPFIISAIYVLFVTRLGPSLMRNRMPFDLRVPMIAYNFSIVAAYSYCLSTLIYYFFTTDCFSLLCTPTVIAKGHCTYECSSVGWLIYVLKYAEFADTVFFILRKKFRLITNLHVVHHAALPIICWVMLRTEKSGFQLVPGGINAFVHIIMYTYYGLSAMGPQVQKILWWKEYLTLIQMTQFVVILMFLLVIVPLSGCKTSTHGVYIDMFFAVLFLLLFYNFYTKTYKKSLKGERHSKGDTAKLNGCHENGMRQENGMHPKAG